MERVPKIKKRRMQGRTLLYSVSAGLLAASAVIIVFLLLHVQQRSSVKPAAYSLLPEEQLIEKEYVAPTEAPTEPPTEPISYEMKIDMQKIADHHAVNPDVAGWIYIEDTIVDYPIMQSDDNEKYLDRDWLGEYSHSGSIFADYQCKIASSNNSLLYGHNMANGSMFYGIKHYRDTDWAAEHPYFEVATLTKRYLYKAVSVNVLYGEDGADFRYWDCVNMTQKEYQEFARTIQDTSYIWYGWAGNPDQIPKYGTRLITLQTCDSGADDGMRFIVFGECLGEF